MAVKPFIYQFYNVRVEAEEFRVFKDGKILTLEPKAFAVLIFLLEQRGRLITKDELLDAVWKDSFVTPNALTRVVAQLRRALGDASQNSRIIETVPTRGYRFIAEVETQSKINSGVPQQPESDKQTDADFLSKKLPAELPPKSRNRLFFGAGLICGLVFLTVFAAVRFGNYQTPTDSPVNEALQPVEISLKRLTPNLYALNPAISPNGELVAYGKSEENGGNSLWLKNLVSDKTVQLLPPVVKGYTGLQFSPDGRQIYFLTGKQKVTYSNLARINIDGGAVEEIVENVPGWFAVSPDGSKVTFVRDTKLIVAETDRSGEKSVAERDSKAHWFVSLKSQPSWSPDGQRIALCGGYLEQGREFSELLEVNIADGAEKRIPTPKWNQIGTTAWLANGAALLVTAREDASKPFQIWRLSTSDGAAVKITNDLHNYNSLSLTADSRRLAAEQSLGQSNIWTAYLADTAHAERLNFNETENIGTGGLAFMPDGRIVYTSAQNGNSDLWIMNADGGDQKQLTSNMGNWNNRPRITPDGRFIFFQSFNDKKNHIWRIDSDGGNPVRITDGNGECCPAVSPDGQWVYYNTPSEKANVISKISINGSGSVRVSENNNAGSPSVSPDGKLLAFEYFEENSKEWKVGVMSAETGETLKLFDISIYSRTIFWTPDSKSFIYSIRDSANLWEQPLDGGAAMQITHFGPEQIWNFTVSPDFQKIAVARGNSSTEAILINIL